MKTLFVLVLLASTVGAMRPARADEDQTHLAAHMGASFALSIVAYGFYEKAFRMDPTTAFIFSAVTTLAIGLTYKMMEGDGQPPPGVLRRSMLQNAAGVGAAGMSVLVFQF